MASQTTAQLSATLGLRVEDPAELKFTEDMKESALNRGQRQIAQLLDPMYLTELQNVQASTMNGNPLYYLSFSQIESDSSATILNGAQSIIAVKDGTGWLHKTTLSEQIRLQNTLLAGSSTNKVYYIYDEKIWISNGGTTTDTITVYFLKAPTTMAVGGTAPVINECLYDIMLRFAEAILWRADDELKRAEVAYEEAMEYIDFLNQLAIARRPRGIGTKSQERAKVQG